MTDENDDEDDDDLAIPGEQFWLWAAASVLIARDNLTEAPKLGSDRIVWFLETIEPTRAATLVAEVMAMSPDERGMHIMRSLGDYDA